MELVKLYQDLRGQTNRASMRDREALQLLYAAMELTGTHNNRVKGNISLRTKGLDKANNDMVMEVLRELELFYLVKQLQDMTIYFQENPVPKNRNQKALYAKAVLPRFGEFKDRKHVGIHFGTKSNHPEGWSEQNKESARRELIEKGLKVLTNKDFF